MLHEKSNMRVELHVTVLCKQLPLDTGLLTLQQVVLTKQTDQLVNSSNVLLL